MSISRYTGIHMQSPVVKILYREMLIWQCCLWNFSRSLHLIRHPRKCRFTTTLVTKIMYLSTLKWRFDAIILNLAIVWPASGSPGGTYSFLNVTSQFLPCPRKYEGIHGSVREVKIVMEFMGKCLKPAKIIFAAELSHNLATLVTLAVF